VTVGRFLFVTPPLAGHVNPALSLAGALADGGHDVAWAGHREGMGDRLPPGTTFFPVADRVPPDVQEAVDEDMRQSKRGPAAIVAVWEDYVAPVARQMGEGVAGAVDHWRPDVVVADQLAFAGAAAAERSGLPWATVATTPAEAVTDHASLGKLGERLHRIVVDTVVALGIDPVRAETFDPRFSPHLVLLLSLPELLLPGTVLPAHHVLVGPAIGDRPDDTAFPWDWLDPGRPLVLVTLGSLNWERGARFFRVAAEALGGLAVGGVPAQGIVVAPPELVPDAPDNVLVLPRVPQLALLPRVSAVVGHGGHNTVCETLAEGRPLILAPITHDQPYIAGMVAAGGAGIRVKFLRVSAEELRAALHTVLTEPGYLVAAQRAQRTCRSLGGAAAAAEHLEKLLF
jgi:UDP:flavonoid glycosyltransferase YjiC (YdhE family)